MRRATKNMLQLKRRHRRIRGKVSGTPARPRLAVSRSSKQIYAQVIDDIAGHTICSSSTLQLGKSGGLGDEAKGSNVAGAELVGADVAKKAMAAGIKTVAFDRGGFRYHGRIKALADAARKEGLDF